MRTLHDLLQQPAFADLTILTTEASLRVPNCQCRYFRNT